MEWPAVLKSAVARALEGVPLSELQRASERLSQRYRSEIRDGRLHLASELDVKAYIAARMPATYAALREAMLRIAEVHPDFVPATLLDVGAGPGTAFWAARDAWPGLAAATLVEASAPARIAGQRLLADAGQDGATWVDGDALRRIDGIEPAALVTLAYVLDELSAADGIALAERLWDRATGMLLLVEPGTPAGWRRILAVRDRLLARGAHVIAPCPHAQRCPLIEPDWCHFARRVARSRLHRQVKLGDVGWEDEKYIYLALGRTAPVRPLAARVIAPPQAASGRIGLKLCCADAGMRVETVTRRSGDDYRRARRADWGDGVVRNGAADRTAPGDPGD